MSVIGYLAAAVFLPLFPFSMVFNRVLARLGDLRWRIAVLLLWPQLGVLALLALGESPATWVVWWAAATAALYALRALALRDLRLWTGFMATSAWALLWPAAAVAPPSADASALILQAAGLSGPLILLAWLAERLESELGAAYAGVASGLALSMPRTAAALTLAVLAAVATPLTPGFFTLLATTVRALPVMPGLAVLVMIAWLLWAWAGARILSGFIGGAVRDASPRDLAGTTAALLALAFALLVLAGIGISGGAL